MSTKIVAYCYVLYIEIYLCSKDFGFARGNASIVEIDIKNRTTTCTLYNLDFKNVWSILLQIIYIHR